MFIVVAYDVACDKRRNRLARAVLAYGGERVNYSVLECELQKKQYDVMQKEIEDIIDPDEDRVRYYELCRECVAKVRMNGKAGPYEEAPTLFV